MAGLTNMAVDEGTVHTRTLIDAATANTTSSGVPCAGVKKITAVFTRANHSSGNSVFSIEGSIDGTIWWALDLLAHDGSKTRSAATAGLTTNGSYDYDVDLEHAVITEVRAKVVETTDGTHTAEIALQF